MNILFLTSRFPFPPIGGDKLRPYWFIKELSKRHRIHLLSFAQPGECDCVDQELKERIKISTVRHSHLASCFKTAMNILKDQPLQVSYYYYQSMQNRLNAIIREEKIDLVLVHLIRMAKYVMGLQHPKKMIDFSDSFGLLYANSYKARRGIFKFIDYMEKKRIGRFEKACLACFDKAIISSAIDKKWIEQDTGSAKINRITNGVEPSSSVETDPRAQNSTNIAFIGNMRSFSNTYAVMNFAKEVFPLIKRQVKDARLFVIGASPPRSLSGFLKDKSIQITGRVDDVDLYLKQCAVGIAPMSSCSGVQNKILKYMALKMPTVATRIALGDLGSVPGRDIIIADSRQELAKEIICLLKDRRKRATIGENGYKYVTANHNWQEIIDKLDSLLTV